MNKVMLIGNVGKEPDVRHLEGGAVVASFSLATNKTYRNKSGEKVQETEWHNLVCWNKTAEICEKYVKKGDKLYVEGELRTRDWEDKEGNKRYTTEIVFFQMEMLGSTNERSDNERRSDSHSAPASEQTSVDVTEEEDDLPF